MFLEFGISRSTMSFKMTIAKVIDKYSKVRNSSLPFNFAEKHEDYVLTKFHCTKNEVFHLAFP